MSPFYANAPKYKIRLSQQNYAQNLKEKLQISTIWKWNWAENDRDYCNIAIWKKFEKTILKQNWKAILRKFFSEISS